MQNNPETVIGMPACCYGVSGGREECYIIVSGSLHETGKENCEIEA